MKISWIFPHSSSIIKKKVPSSRSTKFKEPTASARSKRGTKGGIPTTGNSVEPPARVQQRLQQQPSSPSRPSSNVYVKPSGMSSLPVSIDGSASTNSR
mmetsp:Transcript_14343/g.23834  ORF Transcript_14343/g.23834 Transcript_14343/m.23834 type:complete len:98 (+) Transcript_14343:54-347(+)